MTTAGPRVRVDLTTTPRLGLHRRVHASWSIRSLVLAAALSASACGAKGAEDTLGPTLRYLGEPGGPTVTRTRTLYEALDGATRAAVDARATALGARLGRAVDVDEVIQFRGFDPSVRVSAVEVEPVDATRARLKVALARIDAKADGLMPDPVTFDAVLEDGVWRLSLPQLAAEVQSP